MMKGKESGLASFKGRLTIENIKARFILSEEDTMELSDISFGNFRL